MIKRLVDILLALIGLTALSPVLAVVFVAVRVVDGRPVIYAQERVGLRGQPFRIHKFRTMRSSVQGPQYTAASDARITPLGAVLRRTKLDELPQLVDVLTGHMSIVGPRPEVAQYVSMWPDSSRALCLSVRPGITDVASWVLVDEASLIASRVDRDRFYESVLLPYKCCLYSKYAQNRSDLIDAAIIVGTVAEVLHLKSVSKRLMRGVFAKLEAESCACTFDELN